MTHSSLDPRKSKNQIKFKTKVVKTQVEKGLEKINIMFHNPSKTINTP